MQNEAITIKSKIDQEISALETQIYNIKKALTYVGGGFIWAHTPQGSQYWGTVDKELKVLHDYTKDQITELAKQLDDEIGVATDD